MRYNQRVENRMKDEGSAAGEKDSAAVGNGATAEDKGPAAEDKGPTAEDKGTAAGDKGATAEDKGTAAKDKNADPLKNPDQIQPTISEKNQFDYDDEKKKNSTTMLEKPEKKEMGIPTVVAAVAAMFVFGFPLGIIAAALVVGAVAYKNDREYNNEYKDYVASSKGGTPDEKGREQGQEQETEQKRGALSSALQGVGDFVIGAVSAVGTVFQKSKDDKGVDGADPAPEVDTAKVTGAATPPAPEVDTAKGTGPATPPATGKGTASPAPEVDTAKGTGAATPLATGKGTASPDLEATAKGTASLEVSPSSGKETVASQSPEHQAATNAAIKFTDIGLENALREAVKVEGLKGVKDEGPVNKAAGSLNASANSTGAAQAILLEGSAGKG